MRWKSSNSVCMAAMVLSLASCSEDRPDVGSASVPGRVASATLRNAAGDPVGSATVRRMADGLSISITAAGLPPGLHGAHVHSIGKCEGPDFASAGPHWNPKAMKHGSVNPQGPHAGDLPNLVIGADGHGTLTATLARASLEALLDADGAALVIHAAPDDLMTDPSGNSGARLACGVLVAR